MSVHRIVSQNSQDESVEWYGAEVGDLVEVIESPIPEGVNNIWLKGSKVFDKAQSYGYKWLCVADTKDDFLKYVEKV